MPSTRPRWICAADRADRLAGGGLHRRADDSLKSLAATPKQVTCAVVVRDMHIFSEVVPWGLSNENSENNQNSE